MTRPAVAAVPPAERPPIGRLLTPREVADILRCSPSMVRALTRRGELTAIYAGRLPRYPADAVAAYVARATRGGGR